MDDARDTRSLTEDAAARLLDRAAKLDAEGGPRVTVEELRQVALEAGISAESFDRALAEMGAMGAADAGATPPVPTAGPSQGSPGTRPKHSESLLATILQRTGIFATGSALALLSQLFIYRLGMHSEPVMVFTLVIAMFMAIWFVVTRRRGREVFDFEIDLGILWAAITFWLMVANPSDAGSVLEVMMPAGLIGSLVGGLLVATGPDEDGPRALPETT